MSWTVHLSASSRHVLFRASSGEVLPDALAAKLRDEGIACGWLRASGVLHDVELCAFDAAVSAPGRRRRLAGPVQVVSLESSIGLADGDPSFTLRALLARETDSGLQTLAGEIVSARTIALEVLVTVLDDVTIGRAVDPAAGVSLIGAGASSGGPRAAPSRDGGSAGNPSRDASPGWSSALEASEGVDGDAARARSAAVPAPSPSGTTMPQRPRPVRPVEVDMPLPEAGDAVEHFAFGPADVIKSDGDRLHLRVHKDGRIREIALEMLRVSRLEDTADGKRRFRLERRL